ncbi:spermatogenesis-associated protein 48 [Coturnix japonica]|uniref:Sperm microtubule inner protein 7 n=1 Tax=Coturnix japonica TaxID=93934 RepID=A0A8C2YDC2_COTJA|nr:spermatogenesis-associated protein 48 [Coturnix japonica]XP_032298349.1 spermatogenesis-associated protein 48 [Coturnix japonica]
MTVISHGAKRRTTTSVKTVPRTNNQQYRNRLKKTCMPFVRGPENRHDFASFEEKGSNSFLKFNPDTPPFRPNYSLFPHRDDVPLIDPCSGFVSAGADADLRPGVGKFIESLADYSDVKPQQRVPTVGNGARAVHKRHMILQEEISQDRRWNSRAVPAAWIRAKLRGQTTPVKGFCAPPDQHHNFAFYMDPNLKELIEPSASWREEKAKDYLYKSSTQKAYEEVPWDNILPPKIPPPESTLEVMADPVSQCFTKRRYNPEPDISQVIGSLWDRIQRRHFSSLQRPVNFISRSPRICQIPLYTGCVGAESFEDIDNPSVELIVFNHVQTPKPRYAKTAHTPNIPGYAGKVHWLATHPANSNLPSTSPSIISQMRGHIAKSGRSSQYHHQGPLSQLMTPVSPQNPFNKIQRETITV